MVKTHKKEKYQYQNQNQKNNKKPATKTKKTSKNNKISRLQSRKSNDNSASFEIDLDMTDKSMRDFQASKSITVATTKSDITSSKIGELYDVKPIHDNIQRLCNLKIAGKIAKEYPQGSIPKHVSKQICKCLFEKNSGLRIVELEKLVKSRMDTPASSCVAILDKSLRSSKSSSSKSKSSKTSMRSSA
jgi:hypothetical protein